MQQYSMNFSQYFLDRSDTYKINLSHFNYSFLLFRFDVQLFLSHMLTTSWLFLPTASGVPREVKYDTERADTLSHFHQPEWHTTNSSSSALYIYTCLLRTGLASLYKETDPIPLPYKLKPTPPTEWALDPACIIMPSI